jgi:hypothetical protein
MYAWCQNMPGVSADDYGKVLAELGGAEKRAEGLVAHVAGPIDGGFRIIDVWESRELAQRFSRDHLEPAVQRAHGETQPEMTAAFQVFEVSD